MQVALPNQRLTFCKECTSQKRQEWAQGSRQKTAMTKMGHAQNMISANIVILNCYEDLFCSTNDSQFQAPEVLSSYTTQET